MGWAVFRKDNQNWVKIAYIPDAHADNADEAIAVVRRMRSITKKTDTNEYKVERS